MVRVGEGGERIRTDGHAGERHCGDRGWGGIVRGCGRLIRCGVRLTELRREIDILLRRVGASRGGRGCSGGIGRRRVMRCFVGLGDQVRQHVAEIGRYADAAVVGSALVALIASEAHTGSVEERVTRYIQSLRGACVSAGA